ncbi:HNH endonuclease [Rhizobacter sp. LjRoot28]|uniref:HNH endonuclease n=1 Tax=Rhizobacter sp. LjRoot28 TaxID=3342309 RepID=UPI003ED05AAC
MTTAKFNLSHNEAFEKMLGRTVGTQWFGFDTGRKEARAGKASLLVLALETWGFRRDSDTGELWFCQPRKRDGERGGHRVGFWNAVDQARADGIPIRGFLKDEVGGLCTLDFQFDIVDVAYEPNKLWMKLQSGGRPDWVSIPHRWLGWLDDLPRADPGWKSLRVPRRQVASAPPPDEAAAHGEILANVVRAGERVAADERARRAELEGLEDQGMDFDSADMMLHTYLCLVAGKPLSSNCDITILGILVDNIVARNANAGLSSALDSLRQTIGSVAGQQRLVLDALISTLQEAKRQADALAQMETAARLANVPSSLIKPALTRGPHHAAFARLLWRRWGNKCSVLGKACNRLLVASHIIGWSEDEGRRADVNNGLLLTTPLDRLFDKGFISFNDAGLMLVSSELSAETREHFGVAPGMRIQWDWLPDADKAAMRTALREHRSQHNFP